jgi:hypothetical protein
MAAGGGHGTRVAGAVLFGNTIPETGTHTHICWVASARVLQNFNGQALMPRHLHPPTLMQKIVQDFRAVKIFNLSLNANRPHKRKHMSAWASMLDQLHYEEDRLFVISAGNIPIESQDPFFPGIREHFAAGRRYPEYLQTPAAGLLNPAFSAFSLTVGSLAIGDFDDGDRRSLTTRDEPSSFSRSGPGLWDMIKPDVVEYSGDYAAETQPPSGQAPLLTTLPALTAPTVRIPGNGAGVIARDRVGTSFAAPKVTHLAARILAEWPNASACFVRALIAHSARWPTTARLTDPALQLQRIGYGLPSAERILDNTPARITFVAEGYIQPHRAHVYTVRIPDELRNPADAYDYRIEVTLAFKARVRRTRQGTKSYLSSWLDWVSSKQSGESDEAFRQRVAEYSAVDANDDATARTESPNTLKWCIREQNNLGDVKGMKRNDSTLQKDWLHMPSHQLPEHLSIAVVGHKGWERDLLRETAPYALLISIECLSPSIEVYNRIRIHNQLQIEV